MTSATSRYARNTVQAVTGADGVTRQTLMPRTPAAQTLLVTDYVWRDGDRVDLIAARNYGDETMWWVLADANPQVLDWTAVPTGTIVRIPSGSS